MNERFFALSAGKQQTIINAGMAVFSRYDYKHASTDMIAQKAGISKGLLFHYFGNKKNLYLFLWDHAVQIMMDRLTSASNEKSTDFFEIIVSTQQVKMQIMAEYPNLGEFVVQGYLEKDDAVESEISHDYQTILEQSAANMFARTDRSKFKDDITLEQAFNIVLWMAEGYVKTLTPAQLQDLTVVNDIFLEYVGILKHQFYRKEFL